MKYRILLVFHDEGNRPILTCREVAERLGVSRQKVADLVSRWHKYQYGYLRRLERKEEGKRAYRYKINDYGIATMKMYNNRLTKKLDLNCKNPYKPRKAPKSYIGINRYGEAEGINHKEALYRAGLIQRESVKTAV